MSDVREALHRAIGDLPRSGMTIEALKQGQERRAARKRIAAGSVGLAITLAIVGGMATLRVGAGSTSTLEPAAGTGFGLAADQRYERDVRFYQLTNSGASVTEIQRVLRWVPGGRGSSSERGRQVFFDDADRVAYETRLGLEPGETRWGALGGPGTGHDSFTVDRQIPSDPTELEQWLAEGHGDVDVPALDGTPDPALGTTDPGLWHLVYWDLLRDQTTSPDVRSAAVQIAVGLSGVQIDPTAVDPAGRPAIALHMVQGPDVDGWRSVDEWIYADPTTLVPMALAEPQWQEGVVILFATDQIVTDSGEVVRTFVPQLTNDRVPFPHPGEG